MCSTVMSSIFVTAKACSLPETTGSNPAASTLNLGRKTKAQRAR